MVPGDHTLLSRYLERAARARLLAERYPESREGLLFAAAIFEWQSKGEGLEKLRALVRRIGPPVLRRAPPSHEWFSRVMAEFEPPAIRGRAPRDNECPLCGHPPQLGVLRPEGHGSALTLACSLCRHEWPYPRATCPGCGETDPHKIAFGTTEAFPAIQTMTCDSCWSYLHLIDLGKDPLAVPEADELSAQPLDVWAIEQGYRKLTPNWIGI